MCPPIVCAHECVRMSWRTPPLEQRLGCGTPHPGPPPRSAAAEVARAQCTPIHPLTHTPAHLHSCTPIHLRTRTSAHTHIRTPAHPLTRSPAHLQTCTPAHPDPLDVCACVWRAHCRSPKHAPHRCVCRARRSSRLHSRTSPSMSLRQAAPRHEEMPGLRAPHPHWSAWIPWAAQRPPRHRCTPHAHGHAPHAHMRCRR